MGYEPVQNSLIILIESVDSKEIIPLLNALQPLVKHLLLSHSQFNWSLLNSIIEVTENPDLITLLNLELSPGIKIWRYLFDDPLSGERCYSTSGPYYTVELEK